MARGMTTLKKKKRYWGGIGVVRRGKGGEYPGRKEGPGSPPKNRQ